MNRLLSNIKKLRTGTFQYIYVHLSALILCQWIPKRHAGADFPSMSLLIKTRILLTGFCKSSSMDTMVS